MDEEFLQKNPCKKKLLVLAVIVFHLFDGAKHSGGSGCWYSTRINGQVGSTLNTWRAFRAAATATTQGPVEIESEQREDKAAKKCDVIANELSSFQKSDEDH